MNSELSGVSSLSTGQQGQQREQSSPIESSLVTPKTYPVAEQGSGTKCEDRPGMRDPKGLEGRLSSFDVQPIESRVEVL